MNLRNEMLNFLLLSIFARVYCFQFKKNSVNIKYGITNFKSCAVIPTSFHILKVTDLSLNDCVSSCVFRSACTGLNYKKRFLLCELYNGEHTQEYSAGCVNIKRSDIEATDESQIIADADIQNCEDDFTCSVQECPYVEVVGGKVWGNMNSIGSLRTFECNDGYNLFGPNSIKCMTNKTWIPYPVCWKECSAPILHNCEIETAFNGQQPTNATVTCHEGYASTRISDVSSAITEEIITCDKSGVWMPNNIDCTFVISDVNKAWKKPATQSTIYRVFGANQATDGIWISDFFTHPCSHTKPDVEETAWWEVDLQQVYSIRRIKIRNRKKAFFSKRLHDVTVSIGMNPAPTEFCAFYLGDIPPIERIELHCNSVMQGRYVRITKLNTYDGDNLALCEVGVYET